jgi:hypothetical protein
MRPAVLACHVHAQGCHRRAKLLGLHGAEFGLEVLEAG